MSVDDFARSRAEYEDTTTLVEDPRRWQKDGGAPDYRNARPHDSTAPGSEPAVARVKGPPDARGEAFDALVALGYKPPEVKRLIGKLSTDDLSAEDIIRSALKQAAH